MTMTKIALALLATGLVLAEPRIVEVRKIWDAAPHNAFTDLVRYKGAFYCVFREGSAHVSPDGKLRVLRSKDGKRWSSVALLSSSAGDLRDAKITITPDQRLMLSGASALHQPASASHQSFVWFSTDGRNPPSAQDRLIGVIQAKAPYASLMHGEKMVGPSRINDWFEDPAGFLVALQQAGYVIPGRPDISPMLDLMSFTGPMYKVFTDEEQALWREWILSLAAPKPVIEKDPYKNMKKAIDLLRQRQQGVKGHNVQLQRPEPDDPARTVTKTIHEWFDVINTHPANGDDLLMGALSDPVNGWITPGNASASPLITAMLTGNGDMASAFRATAPDTGGLTYQNVIVEWIDAGSPDRR